MERYYQIKKKLFEDDSLNRCVTVDDAYGSRLYRELKTAGNAAGQNLKTCSVKLQEADFYGKIVSSSISGSVMEVYENGVLLCRLRVNMPGVHFASDALLAAGMARQAGASAEDIAHGISSVQSVKGRMEMIGRADETLGIVDYAHTPDGLERLLETVSGICRGRIICVFGCGGFRDHEKRSEMGSIAGRYSDYCIITNDNPRGEPPENIAQAIEEGLHPTGCGYAIILDRAQAIKRAVSLADKWDIIVVAGKGHEAYQLSGGQAVPFDDRKVLKEFLEKKYERTYNEADRNGYRRPADLSER
jgi:UDP-N-acetylmuramoyl-L-alanyl-D-glutamate--2,6-diaminopimelate ligase